MSMRLSVALLVIAVPVVSGSLSGCSQSSRDQAGNSNASTPAAEGQGDYNPHDVPITEQQKAELRAQDGEVSRCCRTGQGVAR